MKIKVFKSIFEVKQWYFGVKQPQRLTITTPTTHYNNPKLGLNNPNGVL
jgi:hypothetical protein